MCTQLDRIEHPTGSFPHNEHEWLEFSKGLTAASSYYFLPQYEVWGIIRIRMKYMARFYFSFAVELNTCIRVTQHNNFWQKTSANYADEKLEVLLSSRFHGPTLQTID